MSDPIERQAANSPAGNAEAQEHSNARFAHWEEEQAWEKEAQKRKVMIIAAFVGVGALIWAWMVFA